MTEFTVDVAALRDMAGRLKGLKEDFESQDDTMSGYEDALGSDELAGALNDFADNWSDKREQIGEMLQEVSGYAEMAADAYWTTEQELTSSIEESRAASSTNASGN